MIILVLIPTFHVRKSVNALKIFVFGWRLIKLIAREDSSLIFVACPLKLTQNIIILLILTQKGQLMKSKLNYCYDTVS